jgi:hypothetical protein
MFAILFDVLVTMFGGVLAAGLLAWLSWTALSRTRFPGLGPMLAFAMLAVIRNAGDFTQTLLMFSAIFALAGFATLFGTLGATRLRPGKPRHSAAGPNPGK